MKYIVMVTILIFFLNANDCMQKGEQNKIDCMEKKIEKSMRCSNIKSPKEQIECLKERMEKEISRSYNGKVQLGVFSKKINAKNIIKKYNDWIRSKKVKGLKKSKAKLNENNGKNFVFVSQKGINAKDLKKKIEQEGWLEEIYTPSQLKVMIDIDNKIIKKSLDKVTILKAKIDCYSKYKRNKLSKLEFEKCLKRETITAMQIHALPDKVFCKKAKKDCIEKKVGDTMYYTIVETIKSSDKVAIEKIKQQKSKPFKLEKPPEVSIK